MLWRAGSEQVLLQVNADDQADRNSRRRTGALAVAFTNGANTDTVDGDGEGNSWTVTDHGTDTTTTYTYHYWDDARQKTIETRAEIGRVSYSYGGGRAGRATQGSTVLSYNATRGIMDGRITWSSTGNALMVGLLENSPAGILTNMDWGTPETLYSAGSALGGGAFGAGLTGAGSAGLRWAQKLGDYSLEFGSLPSRDKQPAARGFLARADEARRHGHSALWGWPRSGARPRADLRRTRNAHEQLAGGDGGRAGR